MSLWPAFGLGLAVAVGNGLARFAYGLILPAMRESLEWTYVQAGWLNTANAIGYVVGAALGLVLLRHASPERLFSCGLWLILTSVPLTAVSADLVWLSVARLLSGVGAAWLFACGSALVSSRYQHDQLHRGTATGLYFSGAGIGIFLSGLTVGPLLGILGPSAWREAWLTLGAMSALLAIWPLWLARGSQIPGSVTSSGTLDLRGLWMPLLAYFFFAAGYIVYMTFVMAWIRSRGWPWPMSVQVWLALGAAVAISPFAWRRALDRWPPRATLSASCACTLAGTLLMTGDTAAGQFALSAAMFGLGVFIAPSAIALLVRQSMPQQLWAKGMTVFTVVFAVGQAIGPVAAGWIADKTTLSQTLTLGACLLASGLAASVISLAKIDAVRGNKP